MGKRPSDSEMYGSSRGAREVASKEEGYPHINPLNGKLYMIPQSQVQITVITNVSKRTPFIIPVEGGSTDMKNKIFAAVAIAAVTIAAAAIPAIYSAVNTGKSAVEVMQDAKGAAVGSSPDAIKSGTEMIMDSSSTGKGSPPAPNIAKSDSKQTRPEQTKQPTKSETAKVSESKLDKAKTTLSEPEALDPNPDWLVQMENDMASKVVKNDRPKFSETTRLVSPAKMPWSMEPLGSKPADPNEVKFDKFDKPGTQPQPPPDPKTAAKVKDLEGQVQNLQANLFDARLAELFGSLKSPDTIPEASPIAP
jgi:hypothetical protein